MRYALIQFDPLLTSSQGVPDATVLVPRFRGVFDSVPALLDHVRNDFGRGIFVISDPSTGEREEWNGRLEGSYELVPLENAVPGGLDGISLERFASVHRVFVVSPHGRRHETPCWVEEIDG
jgi:hypothetical protein